MKEKTFSTDKPVGQLCSRVNNFKKRDVPPGAGSTFLGQRCGCMAIPAAKRRSCVVM